MADFLITSLEGGYSEETPITLENDQCVTARNVTFINSPLGERRTGLAPISISGSALVGHNRVTFLYRHLPTTDQADSELWALGVTGTSSSSLVRKTTTWNTVTVADAMTLTGGSQYLLQAQTLHGKLFLAYDSSVDRLHVWDGTSLRRSGLAEPSAPTGADTGAGTFSGTRYYRVRYTVQSGGVTLRRSEPSAVLTFVPSGTGSAARITKPASISESETHWELEASLDNNNFYVIATTVVGTTTYDDSTNFNTGYGAFTLSETVGNYSTIWSVRYLTVDEDRLIFGGSFEDAALASTIGWTPVGNATGAGNDERVPVATTNTLTLDNYEGGSVTGLSRAVNGVFYAFKHRHVYRVSRRGVLTQAYDAIPLTKQRGAIHGSLIEFVDENGQPALFALDPDVGPIMVRGGRITTIGGDLYTTWKSINLDATDVVARGVVFPELELLIWYISTSGANKPNLAIVLHVNLMRETVDGGRRGWVLWDCPQVLTTCLYAENIDDNTARSLELHPLVGVEGGSLILQLGHDTSIDDDDGSNYTATIKTKPYVRGNLLHQFSCKSGSMLATALTGAKLDVKVIGTRADLGEVTKEVTNISLTAGSGEGAHVIRHLDNLHQSAMNAVQVVFEDSSPVGTGQWAVEQFALRDESGQKS